MRVQNIFLNLIQKMKNYLQEAKQYQDDFMTDYIRCNTFQSAAISCAAKSTGQVIVPYEVPTGYKALAYIQTGSHGAVVPSYVSGWVSNNRVSIWWSNQTSNVQNCYFSVRILFVKEVGGGNT